MQPREKARLYHDLGELVRSGMTLPRAIERLGTHSRGATRRALQGIAAALGQGNTAAESLALQPGINGLDAALFAASERSGKLDRGFKMAADYYAAIAEARSRILWKSAYPLVVAHMAAIVFPLASTVFTGGSMATAAPNVVTAIAILWAFILGTWLLAWALRKQAANNPALDRAIAWIPLIGGMRRDLALSRFAAAYDMQLEAGVNVFASLNSAGAASASASIRAASAQALEYVRAGETVGASLASTRAFPERLLRSFAVGEDTGRLDQELQNVSEEYRAAGLRKLEILSEWIPRLVLIGVAIAIGWKVVSFYAGYLRGIEEMTRFGP